MGFSLIFSTFGALVFSFSLLIEPLAFSVIELKQYLK